MGTCVYRKRIGAKEPGPLPGLESAAEHRTRNAPDEIACMTPADRKIHTAGTQSRREIGSMKHFYIDHHWDAIKGQLRQRYGQLTDNDLAFAEGKTEELLAHLRQKLSISAQHLDEVLSELHDAAGGKLDQIKAKIGEFTDDARAKAGELTDAFKVKAAAVGEEAKAQAAAAFDNARQRASTLLDEGCEYVRENPRQSLLAALCAGFVAGLMLRR